MVVGDRQRPARIRAEQERMATSAVRHELYAYSAHHRARLDAAGLAEGKMGSAADLTRVPPIRLDDIEDPSSLVLRPDGASIRRYGSRGLAARLALARFTRRLAALNRGVLEPLYKPIHWIIEEGVPIGSSAVDLELLAELGRQVLEIGGVRPSDVVVSVAPCGPHLPFWQLALGARRAGLSALMLDHLPGPEELAAYRPTVLAGRPGDLMRALQAAQAESRLDRLTTVLSVGSSEADRLDDGRRRRLGELAGPDAAVVEAWAPPGVRAMWAQCRGGRGLHTWPLAELVQLVDPLSAAPVPPGADGEVVWTSIGWRGTTMLRLRTGLYGILDETVCPTCGRTTPRVLPTDRMPAFAAVLDGTAEVSGWQAELRTVKGQEELLVYLTLGAVGDPADLLQELGHHMSATQFVVVDQAELDARLAAHGDARLVDLR